MQYLCLDYLSLLILDLSLCDVECKWGLVLVSSGEEPDVLKLISLRKLKETDHNFMFISFCLHSISQKGIDTVAVNPSGEWLAFGCKNFGQLLVWEWQSETYILRQQGHYYDINTLSFSQDGHYVATGGDDGKVCKS